jgi:Co/Zn/Cd efflux system component
MVECGCRDDVEILERKTLWILLAINGAMFLVEAVTGWLADSTGLLADSLDMLADATVYGTALCAVGRPTALKRRAAIFSGWIQIALGIGVIVEVVRRLVLGSEPVSGLMITMGIFAFVANITCLILLAKHRSGAIHMRASWIFSTNDVIANAGVILSGLLVMLSGSRIPDLVIGAIVAVVVIRGGRLILQEARDSRE